MMLSTFYEKKTWILVGFIIAKFALQYLLVNPGYDLHRDEFLHLDQGKHLAWGYISVPPVTSWIAYIIKLLGNGYFWVKFLPALFGALTILIVWKTIEALNGNLFALVLGSLSILLSVILRINILFQPNSLDIFFWTLLYYILVKYISTNNAKWLIIAGVATGFAILSKYNIIFLFLGLLPAILLSKHRNIFRKKELYIGMCIALLIISPNIIWQYQNHFPTLRQLQELSETQLANVNRVDFIKEQILFFLSSLFVIIAAFIAFFIYEPFKKYRIFFWSYFFTLGIFIFLKAKGYYAIGLYPVLIAFGAVYLEQLLNAGWKRYLRPVSIACVAVLCIPFILLAFPYDSPEHMQKKSSRFKEMGLLRWEDGKDHNMPQDFADMLGWQELAIKVDSIYRILPDKSSTLVMCDNYGQAGAVNYYSSFSNINAISFNADYINWIPLQKPISSVILVQEAKDNDPERTEEKLLFDHVSLTGTINNPYAREQGTKIFLLKGAKTNINTIIETEIRSEKNAVN